MLHWQPLVLKYCSNLLWLPPRDKLHHIYILWLNIGVYHPPICWNNSCKILRIDRTVWDRRIITIIYTNTARLFSNLMYGSELHAREEMNIFPPYEESPYYPTTLSRKKNFVITLSLEAELRLQYIYICIGYVIFLGKQDRMMIRRW